MGIAEREIRGRAVDSLAEMTRLDVRRGFGFYDDGLLVAAAWDGAFQLRYREDGHWKYRPVDPVAVDWRRLGIRLPPTLDPPLSRVLVGAYVWRGIRRSGRRRGCGRSASCRHGPPL